MKTIGKLKPVVQFDNWEKFVIILLIVMALAGPWILSRSLSFIDVSFLNTGQIGDTIGGISAPFVNLLAAFIVYKSFTAQIEANRDQRLNHEAQMKLIRQEQTLNTIIHLFEKVEHDVYAKEKKLNSGSYKYLVSTIEQFYAYKPFVNEDAKNRATENLNSNVTRGFDVINFNVRNLTRIYHLIQHYAESFESEDNVFGFTNFYVLKLSEILDKTKYSRVIKEKLFIKIGTEDELSKDNFDKIANCHRSISDLIAKTQMYSSYATGKDKIKGAGRFDMENLKNNVKL